MMSNEHSYSPDLSNSLSDNQKVRSIRLGAILEALAYICTVIVCSYIFSDGTRFIGASFHPFWFIVLLITVQYGPTEGLLTALLATIFLLVGNMPEQSFSETMYGYVIRVGATPFMWFVTTLIIGLVRTRQINEKEALTERMERLEKASTAIVENYTHLKQSKEHLELRLAEERRSVLTVYGVAKSLETLDPFDADLGIRHLVCVALGPKKFSLYKWHKNKLILDTSFGWTEDDQFQKQFDIQHPLVKQILKDKRVLSVTSADDEKILQDQGMLAGTIVHQETGALMGLLKIEDMSFTEMGLRTQETFAIVCEWIARVQANVEAHQLALKALGDNSVDTDMYESKTYKFASRSRSA